jgi:glutathione S-transferase
MAGYGSLERVQDTLERAVSQCDYLAGDSFTAADLYLGAHIGWGMQFGTLERRPAFESYWQRLAARPAAQRAKQIDDELVPKDFKTPTLS